jgi:ABC-type dipeptide/oligopeptide/nickel transport system permease component
MAIFLARRLAGTFLALLAISLVVFVALAATPGDAASALVGDAASTTQLQELRSQMGLDRPLVVRYAVFLRDVLLHGDLGRSLVSKRPVSELVLERLPYSVVLALSAVALATVAGCVVGMFAALRAATIADTALMGGAALGMAVPTFWSGLLFIMVFSQQLRWLPVTGAETPKHLILPALTLALPTAAAVARLTRAGLLETLGADYVRTAHAKGLTPRRILGHHVLRNGALPMIAVLGLQLGHLLGGAFIVESIFGWPGLGRLTVQAIFDRDYPVVMGAALAAASMYLAVMLLVDLAHGWLDPQVARGAL